MKLMVKDFFRFLADIWRARRIVFELSKADFRSRYLGSYLGLLWAFIHPLVTILIFWFVFEVGFKSQPVQNFPFILWLMAGIIPWFFFSDGLSGGCYAVIESSFLVKKVVFRVSVLPLVKILPVLAIHVFFLGVMLLIFALYGYLPGLHTLQVVYYMFALFVMALGLSWLASALVVFVRDVGQLVKMVLQFGFWITPVFWAPQILPEKYRFVVQLNPLHYIVTGYRESLIDQVWFWEHPLTTLYFWIVAALVFAGGAIVFRRLRPHFADVL
jgi:lipopolysaccharide transport system permease protein/teichoic acid transport system permease protein